MTRQEIEQQLIADNPSTNIEGVTYLPGSPQYSAILTKWADAMEAQQSAVEDAAKEATFRATIATGHCVTPEGYCLAMDDQDRANWSQLLVLLREAESLGAINGSSPVQFLDITGTLRTATLTRFRQIIVSLGEAYQNAFFTRHS